MRSSKKWINILIIIAVTVCLLIALDFLLYPCTFTRNDVHKVTTESFDDVYLGTSHGKINIDPAAVEEVSGRTGHNLCVGGEYSVDAYYLAKLMLEKRHAPKRIVYEVSPGYFTSEKEEGNNYLLFYHEFAPSRSRLSYFFDSVARCNLRTMFFPWYEYPLSYELEHLPETVRKKATKDYSTDGFESEEQAYHENGFVERYPVDTDDLTFDGLEEMYPEDVIETNMEYLDRLIELCGQQDIEFVAVMTPLPEKTLQAFAEGYNELNHYYDKYFESKNVRFINFNNEEYYDLTDHSIQYFTDLDGHMHGNAARAFSEVLASQLDPEQSGKITWDEAIKKYDTEQDFTDDETEMEEIG